MAKKLESPAGDGGAFGCLAGRLDGSKDKPKHRRMQFQPGADECIYRLGRALQKGRLKAWGFNFVRSVLRHNMRRGWKPSEKQLTAMRGLVAELAEPDEDLIDGGDDDCAA